MIREEETVECFEQRERPKNSEMHTYVIGCTILMGFENVFSQLLCTTEFSYC